MSVTSKDIANNVAGIAVNRALAASGLGLATMGTSIGGDVLAKYISDSDRIIKGFQEKGVEQAYIGRYGKEGTMSYQFEKFTEYYAEQYQKPDIIKGMAQTVAGTTIGDGWFKEGFATSMQFKNMIENHGSMQEYETMNKRMGGELQLPAYVKFRAEANEELLRLAEGRRDVSSLNDKEVRDAVNGAFERFEEHKDTDKLRIDVYHSAGKYLGDKFIESGGKNQYNDVEKLLWGKGYLFSQNDIGNEGVNPVEAKNDIYRVGKEGPVIANIDIYREGKEGPVTASPEIQGISSEALEEASKIAGNLTKQGTSTIADQDLGQPSVHNPSNDISNGRFA